MLIDVLCLFLLGRNLSVKAYAKGRSTWKYIFLLVLFWIVGKVAAANVVFNGGLIVFGENDSTLSMMVFVAAWTGAFCGAALAFRLAERPVRNDSAFHENINFEPCSGCGEDLSQLQQDICPVCGTLKSVNMSFNESPER